jgi:hypothetical protein
MNDLGSCDDLAAKLLLQVPTQVLDEEWENTLRYWYPDFRSKTEPKSAGGDLPPEFNALRYNARFEDTNEPFFHGLAAIRSRYVRQPPGRFLTL